METRPEFPREVAGRQHSPPLCDVYKLCRALPSAQCLPTSSPDGVLPVKDPQRNSGLPRWVYECSRNWMADRSCPTSRTYILRMLNFKGKTVDFIVHVIHSTNVPHCRMKLLAQKASSTGFINKMTHLLCSTPRPPTADIKSYPVCAPVQTGQGRESPGSATQDGGLTGILVGGPRHPRFCRSPVLLLADPVASFRIHLPHLTKTNSRAKATAEQP